MNEKYSVHPKIEASPTVLLQTLLRRAFVVLSCFVVVVLGPDDGGWRGGLFIVRVKKSGEDDENDSRQGTKRRSQDCGILACSQVVRTVHIGNIAGPLLIPFAPIRTTIGNLAFVDAKFGSNDTRYFPAQWGKGRSKVPRDLIGDPLRRIRTPLLMHPKPRVVV